MPPRGLALSFLISIATASAPGSVFPLALDPFLPASPDSSDQPAVLALTNDSFGPGPVDEWDDFDSFGLRFSAPVGSEARLLAAISGLTARSAPPAEGSRIDEASVGAAWYLRSGAPVWLSVAAGFDATGNFGGLAIQEAFHGDTDVQRPVPVTYGGDFRLAPLAAFKLTFAAATPWSPYLVLAGRGSIPARGALLAAAGLRYGRPGALLGFGAGWRAVGGDAPCATLAVVDAAENGPYVGFELRVGFLDLSFEDMPGMKKTNGAVGFVLGEPAGAGAGSPPLALDLGLVVGSGVAQRVRLAVGLPGGVSGMETQVFFAFAQGWFAGDHPVDTGALFAEYSLGAGATLPIAGGPIALDAGAGPFLSFEQLSTVTAAPSIPLGYRDCLGLAVEAGIRIKLPVEGVPLELGWRLRLRPVQAILLQAQESFAQRGAIDFEVFLASVN